MWSGPLYGSPDVTRVRIEPPERQQSERGNHDDSNGNDCPGARRRLDGPGFPRTGAGRDRRRGPRHRQGGLHLRLPDGRQLPHPARLFRRHQEPRIQGTLEPAHQHPARLHAGRHGDPDAELGHALLVRRRGPARRTHRAHRARRSKRIATSASSSSTGTPTTSTTSAAARPATMAAPFSSPGRAGTARHPRASRRCSAPRPSSCFAVYRTQLFNPGRSRQRQEDPGRLQGAAALGVPRPAGADRRAGDRLHQAADAGRGEDVARVLQRPELRPAIHPDGSVRDRTDGALRQDRRRRRQDLRRRIRSHPKSRPPSSRASPTRGPISGS